MHSYHRRVILILLFLELLGIVISGGVWLLTQDMLVTVISAFIITVLNAYLASVIILTPLERLLNMIDRISKGDFKARIRHSVPKPLVELKDELNELAAHFGEFFTKAHQEKSKYNDEIELLREVFNSVSVGIVGLNEEGEIEMLNQAASHILGVKQDESLGKPINNVFPLVYRGERILDNWVEAVKEKITDEKQWELVEFENRMGEKLNIDISAYHSQSLMDRLQSVIVLIDRTEQRSIEDRKIDFLAMAAHELRTPVTVIRGYLESIEDELGATLTEQQKSDLNRVNYSATRLSEYINHVLNVSRIEQGNVDLDFKETDYNPFVEQIIEELRSKAETRDRELIFKPKENIPQVIIDRSTIAEVISNLVDNAIKYSPPGGKIIIETGDSESGVETTVQDFGEGIPSSLMNKLFTKFYRSHRTRGKHLGTGLGLYMCKQIMDAHQGSIWVNSKEGEGSTFGFTLPTDPAIAKHLINDNNEISRGKHGWIKNHTLYRR